LSILSQLDTLLALLHLPWYCEAAKDAPGVFELTAAVAKVLDHIADTYSHAFTEDQAKKLLAALTRCGELLLLTAGCTIPADTRPQLKLLELTMRLVATCARRKLVVETGNHAVAIVVAVFGKCLPSSRSSNSDTLMANQRAWEAAAVALDALLVDALLAPSPLAADQGDSSTVRESIVHQTWPSLVASLEHLAKYFAAPGPARQLCLLLRLKSSFHSAHVATAVSSLVALKAILASLISLKRSEAANDEGGGRMDDAYVCLFGLLYDQLPELGTTSVFDDTADEEVAADEARRQMRQAEGGVQAERRVQAEGGVQLDGMEGEREAARRCANASLTSVCVLLVSSVELTSSSPSTKSSKQARPPLLARLIQPRAVVLPTLINICRLSQNAALLFSAAELLALVAIGVVKRGHFASENVLRRAIEALRRVEELKQQLGIPTRPEAAAAQAVRPAETATCTRALDQLERCLAGLTAVYGDPPSSALGVACLFEDGLEEENVFAA
jgi:hypothetical protein